MDRDDVGVLERGRQLGLGEEALAEARVPGQLRGDQLERDVALQARVVGAIDDAHPAATDERLDPVAEKRGPDPRVCGNRHAYLPLRRNNRSRLSGK